MQVLSVLTPLGGNHEFVSEYVDVGDYKRIRMNTYSDTILQVILEWTYDLDCNRSPIQNSCRTPSTIWRSESYEVIMPFVRVRILNQSGKANSDLSVLITSQSVMRKRYEKPTPPLEDIIVHSPVEAKCVKSPFSFKAKRKSSLGSKSPVGVSMRDYRIPDFIPQGTILIGGKCGKIITLPPGNVGEIMQMTEHGPAWVLIYPPLLLSKDSMLALER